MKLSQRITENQHELEPRELEIITLIAQGKTNQQIADALEMKLKTVRNCCSRIWPKLGVFEPGLAKHLKDQARAEAMP